MSEVKLYKPCSQCNGEGRWNNKICDWCYGHRFNLATADEIRAAHPKCATCEHKFDLFDSCSLGILEQLEPHLDYCRHHTPREGAEGAEGREGDEGAQG